MPCVQTDTESYSKQEYFIRANYVSFYHFNLTNSTIINHIEKMIHITLQKFVEKIYSLYRVDSTAKNFYFHFVHTNFLVKPELF